MRILDVCPRPMAPVCQGSVVRIGALLRYLSRNHEVRQFCQTRWRGVGGHPWVKTIRLEGPRLVYHSAHPLAAAVGEIPERVWVSAPVWAGRGLSLTRPKLLDELLDWAEVVLIEFPWQYDYCWRRRPDKIFVLASHNVEAAKFAGYARAQGVDVAGSRWLRAIEDMERQAVARANLVLAVSPDDKAEFEQRHRADPSKVVLIANGADTEAYVPVDAATRIRARQQLDLPPKPAILYIGSDVPPNRAGLKWVERLARRSSRYTFLAVGPVSRRRGADGDLRRYGIVDDHRPWMHAADFAICPIRHGGGTKIKLLEGLAAGLPTVAFAESLHGTSLLPDQHVLVAEPSEESLLAAFDRFVSDPGLAARLRNEGRLHIEKEHDWEQIATQLERELIRLTGPRARPTSQSNSRYLSPLT